MKTNSSSRYLHIGAALVGLVVLSAQNVGAAEFTPADPTWLPSHLYFAGGSLRPRVMALVKDPDAPTGEAAYAQVGAQVAGMAADSYTYETIPGRYVTTFFFKVADNNSNQTVVSYGVIGAVAKDPAAAGDNLIYLKASDFKQPNVYQAFEYHWSYYEHAYMVMAVNWHGVKDLWWGGAETRLVEPFSDDTLLEIWRNPPPARYYVPFPPTNAPLPQIPADVVVRRGVPRVHMVEGIYFDRFGVEEAVRQMSGATLTESETRSGGQTADICPNFPTVAELMEHNVLVLADVDIRRLGVLRRYAIKEFVSCGGGLLVLGGPWTYGRCAMRGTWVDQLLPVGVDGRSDWVQLAERAELHWTEAAPVELRSVPLRAKPCVRYAHKTDVRQGGRVFLEAGGVPVLVGWQRGQGRVAAFLGTPMGEIGPGGLGFWEDPEWPNAMAAIIRWLGGEKEARPPIRE